MERRQEVERKVSGTESPGAGERAGDTRSGRWRTDTVSQEPAKDRCVLDRLARFAGGGLQ